MDANYVMDETLGSAVYSISNLRVGQTERVPFLIGKVRFLKINGKSSALVSFYLAFFITLLVQECYFTPATCPIFGVLRREKNMKGCKVPKVTK